MKVYRFLLTEIIFSIFIFIIIFNVAKKYSYGKIHSEIEKLNLIKKTLIVNSIQRNMLPGFYYLNLGLINNSKKYHSDLTDEYYLIDICENKEYTKKIFAFGDIIHDSFKCADISVYPESDKKTLFANFKAIKSIKN